MTPHLRDEEIKRLEDRIADLEAAVEALKNSLFHRNPEPPVTPALPLFPDIAFPTPITPWPHPGVSPLPYVPRHYDQPRVTPMQPASPTPFHYPPVYPAFPVYPTPGDSMPWLTPITTCAAASASEA